MNWAKRAGDYAVAHHTYEHLDYGTNAKICMGFELGAHWQRDQLRTDKAVERVARAINPATWDSATPSCDMRPSLRGDAHRAITALLGEEP